MTENFFNKIQTNFKNNLYEYIKFDKYVTFYDKCKANISNRLEFYKNIKIIFSDSNNINSICYSSILEKINIEDKNLNYVNILNDHNYFINSYHFNVIKWILLCINYFIHINIVFVDIIPLNIIEILKFFENTNISFEIITNDKTSKNFIDIIDKFRNKNKKINLILNENFDSNLGIVNNLLEKYNYLLFDVQILFFNYISNIHNNIDLTEDQINFIVGLYYFFNLSNKSLNMVWEISHEGQTAIDLFINEGKKLSNKKKYN